MIERLIHVRALGIACERPDVVGQETVDDFLGRHNDDGGGTRAPLSLAGPDARRSRQQQRWPVAEHDRALFGNVKELGIDVAQADLRTNVRRDLRKRDERRHDAADPRVTAPEIRRNHRLNVQNLLNALVRPVAEIRIVLERHADHARDRVGRGSLQIGCLLGVGLRRSGLRRCGCARRCGGCRRGVRCGLCSGRDRHERGKEED